MIKKSKEWYRLKQIWHGMKKRCYDYTNDSYAHYGGKGITICDDWLNNFKHFYNWAMKNGYDNSLTLDREKVQRNIILGIRI